MNKRKKKKQAKKIELFSDYYVSSYKELRWVLRGYHEFSVRAKRARGAIELTSANHITPVPLSKSIFSRLDLMRECAEGVE